MKAELSIKRGNKLDDLIVNEVSLSLAVELFEKLDGEDVSELLLTGDNTSLLIMGGDISYICNYTNFTEDYCYHVLNIDADQYKYIEIVVGGVENEYPESMCVSEKNAMKALLTYVETEKMSDDLQWHQEY